MTDTASIRHPAWCDGKDGGHAHAAPLMTVTRVLRGTYDDEFGPEDNPMDLTVVGKDDDDAGPVVAVDLGWHSIILSCAEARKLAAALLVTSGLLAGDDRP